MITVLATGALTLVQDLGRPGWAHLGVPVSGAADRAALRLANRLVGNDEGAAGLEVLLGGLHLRWDGTTPLWVAVTGASTSLTVAGRHQASHRTSLLRPGDELVVHQPPGGLRSYLGVRGGLAGPTALGSRSTDVLSGLGPLPVRPGDALGVLTSSADLPTADAAVPAAAQPELVVDLWPGPRADWFTDAAHHALVRTDWTVSADTNRVAVRLDGPPLTRNRPGELASEGIIRGAVQVPSSGQPLVFGADHPVTGGYPVIAVVDGFGSDRLAQLRPGDRVRFRRVDPVQAPAPPGPNPGGARDTARW